MRAGFEIAVGFGAGGQREDAVDDGLEASRGHEAHDAVEFGLGAHIGAEERKLAAEEEPQVDLGIVAGGGVAGYQAAAGGETGEAVVPGSCSNVLEDDIDAALTRDGAGFLADFRSVVIDEMVGAELLCLLQFFIGAGSGDDARAEEFGNLNGGAADAASCPKDEDILAGLQLGPGKKHVPGGLEDERNRGGFFEAQILRIRQAIYFGCAHEFGAASVNHVAQVSGLTAVVIKASYAGCALATANQWREDDLLADAHCRYVGADLGDLTGDVTARNVRKRNRDVRDAAAHPEVEMVQRASLHAHKHVVRADGGIGGVREFQYVWGTMLIKQKLSPAPFVC